MMIASPNDGWLIQSFRADFKCYLAAFQRFVCARNAGRVSNGKAAIQHIEEWCGEVQEEARILTAEEAGGVDLHKEVDSSMRSGNLGIHATPA